MVGPDGHAHGPAAVRSEERQDDGEADDELGSHFPQNATETAPSPLLSGQGAGADWPM